MVENVAFFLDGMLVASGSFEEKGAAVSDGFLFIAP